MQPFNQKLPPIARPPGNFGTSGIHHVLDPSPSLNPEILGNVAPNDKVRKLAVNALTVARQQALAACHGARAIHGDPALLASEKYRRAHDISTAAIMPCLEPLQKSQRALEKEIASLRTATAGPSGLDISDVKLAEIRSNLSGLPKADRYAKIAKAIERGNDEIAAAVLNADRFFSDFLSDLEFETLRLLWARTRMPESVARLSQLESDLSHVQRTARILQSYQVSCAGPPIVAGGLPGVQPGATGTPVGSPYGNAGVGGIAGAARRARGLA